MTRVKKVFKKITNRTYFLFQIFADNAYIHTVKPVLSGHLKIDKTKILMENGSLMKVESMAECSKAECSKGSILQYF